MFVYDKDLILINTAAAIAAENDDTREVDPRAAELRGIIDKQDFGCTREGVRKIVSILSGIPLEDLSKDGKKMPLPDTLIINTYESDPTPYLLTNLVGKNRYSTDVTYPPDHNFNNTTFTDWRYATSKEIEVFFGGYINVDHDWYTYIENFEAPST